LAANVRFRPVADIRALCELLLMSNEQEHVSTGRMLFGLTAAAVAGLVSFVVLALGEEELIAAAAYAFGHERGDSQILSTAAFYLFFGLPIAVALSIAVGLPVWKRAEARPLRSARNALLLGAAVGALIGLILAALNIALGLETYLNENYEYNSWTYGYQVTRDGLPTLLGWLFEILTLLYFAIAGAVGGLVARWVALPRTLKR